MKVLRQSLPEQVDLLFEESAARLVDGGVRVVVTFALSRRAPYVVIGADGCTRRCGGWCSARSRNSPSTSVCVAIADVPGEAAPGERVTEILNLPGRFAGVARYRDKALRIFEFRSEPID